jgi:hypothetical protein
MTDPDHLGRLTLMTRRLARKGAIPSRSRKPASVS